MQLQQTRRVLDKGQIINVLAQVVAVHRGEPVNQFLEDHQLLDSSVRAIQNFPWQEVADQLKLDRWRLYHWYFETFQRSLNAQMLKEDLALMKELIRDAALRDIILDKQFQQHIKEQLSMQYHRSTFSIAFNNAKRQVYKETNRTEPPRVPFQQVRPAVAMISKQNERINEELKKNIQLRSQPTIKDQITEELKRNLDLALAQQREMSFGVGRLYPKAVGVSDFSGQPITFQSGLIQPQNQLLPGQQRLFPQIPTDKGMATPTTQPKVPEPPLIATAPVAATEPAVKTDGETDYFTMQESSFITDAVTTEMSDCQEGFGTVVTSILNSRENIIPDFLNVTSVHEILQMEQFYHYEDE